ncbi:MAG: hypothetical protein LQ351_004873 [Letrouitia transgressa]|nr:MAG: hypothetical protein LQ351_004873 [Letrouitia transgressa]
MLLCWFLCILLQPFLALAATEYIFFPNINPKFDFEAINQELVNFFRSPSRVKPACGRFDSKIEYWFITAEGRYPEDLPRSVLSRSSLGSGVFKAEAVQDHAPRELTMTCWPEAIPHGLARASKQIYIYDESAGGVDVGHDQEFLTCLILPQQETGFSLEGPIPRELTTIPEGHGTCVASKALGRIGGISKNSHLVIVKTNRSVPSMIDAFLQIQEGVQLKGREGKAVVVFPQESDAKFRYHDAYFPRLRQPWAYTRSKLELLRNLRVLVVLGAGNDGRKGSQTNIEHGNKVLLMVPGK